MKFPNILPLLMLAVLSACHPRETEFEGPSLADRFGEFSIKQGLAASQPAVDFSTGQSVHFTATFSKRIEWVLRIKGVQSGAVKEITGFDNQLDATNSLWNGNTTLLPFFRAEACDVTLIIPEEDSFATSIQINVTGTRGYEGTLVTDFENVPAGGIFQGNFEFELTSLTGIRTNTPAQGSKYYFFEGKDNIVSNYFVGLINIAAKITGANTYFPLPVTVPEQLYFNFFLYGNNDPHTIAVIQLATDTNNNGVYDDGPDQTFQTAGDYPIDFTGWKQFNFTAASVGMTEAQLKKLVAVRVILISNKNTQSNPPGEVSFGIDYLTFTADKALEL